MVIQKEMLLQPKKTTALWSQNDGLQTSNLQYFTNEKVSIKHLHFLEIIFSSTRQPIAPVLLKSVIVTKRKQSRVPILGYFKYGEVHLQSNFENKQMKQQQQQRVRIRAYLLPLLLVVVFLLIQGGVCARRGGGTTKSGLRGDANPIADPNAVVVAENVRMMFILLVVVDVLVLVVVSCL